MDSHALRDRSKKFALSVVRMLRTQSRELDVIVIGKQLLRSSTSVAANYRAAGRARSRAEFFSKLSIVVEEIDESSFWLEMFDDLGTFLPEKIKPLRQEAEELVRIFSSSRKTAGENIERMKRQASLARKGVKN